MASFQMVSNNTKRKLVNSDVLLALTVTKIMESMKLFHKI